MSTTTTTPQMSSYEFAQQVKEKHPEYKDVPDVELTRRVLAKYPEYKDKINTAAAIGRHPSPANLEAARQVTNTPAGGAGYQPPGYWQEQTANANAAASRHFAEANKQSTGGKPSTYAEDMKSLGHVAAGAGDWALGGVGKAIGGAEAITRDPKAAAAVAAGAIPGVGPLITGSYFAGQAASQIPSIIRDMQEHGITVSNTQDAVLTAAQLYGSGRGVEASAPGAASSLNKAPKVSADSIRTYIEHVANRKLQVAANPDTGVSPGGALSRAMDETTKLKNLQAKSNEIIAKQHGQLAVEIDKAEAAGVKLDAATPFQQWLDKRGIETTDVYPPAKGKAGATGMTASQVELVPFLETWNRDNRLSNLGPREGQLLRDRLDSVIYDTKNVPASVIEAAQKLRTIIDQGFDHKVTNWKTLNQSMSGVIEASSKAKTRYADNSMGKFREQLRILMLPQSIPDAIVMGAAGYAAYQLSEMIGGGMYGHIAVTAGMVEAIRAAAKTMTSATMRMKYLNKFADLLYKEPPSGPASYPPQAAAPGPPPAPPRPGLPAGPSAAGPGAAPGGALPSGTNIVGPSTANIPPQAQLAAPQQPLGRQMPPSGGTPPGGIPLPASSLTPQRVMEVAKQAYEEATKGDKSAKPFEQAIKQE